MKFDELDEFVQIVLCFAATVIILTLICWSFSIQEDKLIAQSADPIATKCALGTQSTMTQACSIVSQRTAK